MCSFTRLSEVIRWAENGGVKSYCNEITSVWKFELKSFALELTVDNVF